MLLKLYAQSARAGRTCGTIDAFPPSRAVLFIMQAVHAKSASQGKFSGRIGASFPSQAALTTIPVTHANNVRREKFWIKKNATPRSRVVILTKTAHATNARLGRFCGKIIAPKSQAVFFFAIRSMPGMRCSNF